MIDTLTFHYKGSKFVRDASNLFHNQDGTTIYPYMGIYKELKKWSDKVLFQLNKEESERAIKNKWKKKNEGREEYFREYQKKYKPRKKNDLKQTKLTLPPPRPIRLAIRKTTLKAKGEVKFASNYLKSDEVVQKRELKVVKRIYIEEQRMWVELREGQDEQKVRDRLASREKERTESLRAKKYDYLKE